MRIQVVYNGLKTQHYHNIQPTTAGRQAYLQSSLISNRYSAWVYTALPYYRLYTHAISRYLVTARSLRTCTW